MSKRQTPFEEYYKMVKESGKIDELGLIESLHKTRLPKNLTMKVIYEIYRGQESRKFLNKDELAGFIFERCAIGSQYVFSMFYDKSIGLISVYMASRKKM